MYTRDDASPHFGEHFEIFMMLILNRHAFRLLLFRAGGVKYSWVALLLREAFSDAVKAWSGRLLIFASSIEFSTDGTFVRTERTKRTFI